MTDKMKEKRRNLSELSREAKEIRDEKLEETGEIDFALMGVNDCLKAFIYSKEKPLRFKTYKDWTEEGYQVQKGSKAYLFWARPLPQLKQEKAMQQGEKIKIEDEFKYFPLCYLFSNEQVAKPE